MICFDNHQPEVSRILALKGAEVIVFSNDSDGRERGTLYESYMRVRALDSQVHIVASVNKPGQTLIVNPRGEIVSRTDNTPGALAIATCDLTLRVRDGSGRPIESRYWRVRRSDTFAPLLQDYATRDRAPPPTSSQ
jgi:predicted amidohydrolase